MWSMSVSTEVKEFCAHNLVAIIMQDIKDYFKNMTDEELLSDFTSSKTYSELFKEKNGLWAEGPDYILNLYLEEKGLPPYGGV